MTSARSSQGRPHRSRPRGLRRRIARLVLALVGAAAIWACNAPFIPVPPPGQISFTPQTSGDETLWITQGGANEQAASALFYIFDENTSAGVIQKANPDGTFMTEPMRGTRGDHVRIYFRTPAGENSIDTCLLLIEGPNPAPICP